MVIKARAPKKASKRGGARPGAGRKPIPAEVRATDKEAGSDEKVWLRNKVRWYLAQCEGTTLSQKLENALTELAALKPLGPGRARPRGDRGLFLKESDPFAAVVREHLSST